MNGLIALFCLMIGYIAILSVATLLAQPFRLRLVALIEEMLAEKKWTRDQRDMLEFMGKSCSSSSVGVLLPFAAAYGLAASAVTDWTGPDREFEALERDPRHAAITVLYFISIAGGSPFAAAIAVPLLMLAAGVSAIKGRGSLSRVVDDPIRRVSHTLHSC